MSIKTTIACSIIIFCTVSTLSARDITTNKGKVYKDVDIKAKINGLTIFHAYGASFENFDNLPKTIQQEFHYDKSKADIYEAKLKLKKEQAAAIVAKARALKKKKKHQADQAKKLRAQQQQALLAKLKPLIKQKGIPVTLIRQVLYNLDGKPVFASTKLQEQSIFFLAHDKYMLVAEQIYLIKDNIIPVSEKLSKLKEQIDDLKKLIKTRQTKFEEGQTVVDSNEEKITKAQQVISDYKYRNTTTITTTNTNTATIDHTQKDYYDDLIRRQILLISKYKKDNRELEHDIKTLRKEIKSYTQKLKKYDFDYSVLTEALNKFNTARKKSTHSTTVAQQPKKVQSDLEIKLIKLKVLLDKGLISQAVYDKKSAEIINRQFK